jgi:hypothetical protein
VLVPRNQRGFELVNELKRRRSSTSKSCAAPALPVLPPARWATCSAISATPIGKKLAKVYEVWRRDDREDEQAWQMASSSAAGLLRKCNRWKISYGRAWNRDWLEEQDLAGEDGASLPIAAGISRSLVQRWLGTAVLPVDQAVLTLSQDLFKEPTDLAVAHKLALILRQASEANPGWRLPELTEELAVVARNERRFLGFSAEDTGFGSRRSQGQSPGSHRTQGQRAGVGPGLPDVGQQL